MSAVSGCLYLLCQTLPKKAAGSHLWDKKNKETNKEKWRVSFQNTVSIRKKNYIYPVFNMSQNNRFVKKKKKAQYTQNITYDSSVSVTIIQAFFQNRWQMFKWQISHSGMKLFKYAIGYCETHTDDNRKWNTYNILEHRSHLSPFHEPLPPMSHTIIK